MNRRKRSQVDMPFTVECPNCQRAYKVDEKTIGQRVKCKQCGNAFLIEAPPPADIDPFAEGAFDDAPSEKSVAKPAKVYNNPIESGSISTKAAKAPAQPPLAPPISYRRTGGGGITKYIAINKLTWLILLLFLAVSIGMAIYFSADAFSQLKDAKAATGVAVKIWGWIALFDVLLFLLLGPLLLLGVWGATKVLHSRLESSAYLRACAVAAVAVIFANFAEISPDLLKIALFVLLLPAVYYVLKVIFELDWSESGVALAFGAGGLLAGGFIIHLILGMILTGSIFTAVSDARQLALTVKPPTQDTDTATDSTPPVVDSTPALAPSQDPAAYARFKELVIRKTGADLSQSTREDKMPDVIELKRQQAALLKAFANEPEWADMSHRIQLFEQAVTGLPSSRFNSDIYAESPNADDWTLGQLSRGKLGPEVSILGFKFQPPKDMRLDMSTSENGPEGLIWTGVTVPAARLMVSLRLRTNARQLRPVISDKPAVIRVAESEGLFAVDSSKVIPAEGQVNGLTVTRLVEKSIGQLTQYFVPAGDRWIVISVNAGGDAKFARIMQASARTIREIEPGEPRTDPYSPPLIARRLLDAPGQAAEILRKQGAAGEAAVAALLKDPDNNLRLQALAYLRQFGTTRSIPALRALANDPQPGIPETASDVITKIQSSPALASTEPTAPVPDQSRQGEIPKLLAKLNGNDPAARKEAVEQLALIAPTEADRSSVSTTLALMLRNGTSQVPPADLAAALTVWGDSNVGAELSSLLVEGTDPDLRHNVMHVTAALHDARSAPLIMKWLKTDSAVTVNTMIEMGPAGESAVLPSLKDEDGLVRIDAARILERIGTRKSIAALTAASKDPRDVGAQQAAKIALDSVQRRVDLEPDTTQPTTKP